MKRVLLLVPSLGIGGQEKIAINTANCLKKKYDVSFVIFQKKDIEYEYPCEVINLSIPTQKGKIAKIRNQIKRIIKVARLRKALNADVVMSFGETANITNVGSSIFSKAKTISAIHGFASIKKSVALKLTLKYSDSVICIAKAMQEELVKLFPKAKNTVVVENGYDIESITAKAKAPVPMVLPHPLIVAMGRLEEVKGYDRLIKAFAQAKVYNPDLKLAILGEGSLKEHLVKLAEENGIAEEVMFLGHQKNPYCFLREANLFVLSSRNEGFPNALIEALSCGCPILAVDCPSGPREILSEVYTSFPVKGLLEEKYGVLIENAQSEEKTVKLLGEGILLLSRNENKCREYSLNGLQRANQFSNQVYEQKVEDIIEAFW